MSEPTLADKIRVKRLEKGMNQAELAKAAGLAQATISRLESGEVTQLKSNKLLGLAKALGVSVDFLVDKRQRMEFDETLANDEKAKVLFRGFEDLSEERRKQLLDYVKFLLAQQTGKS